MMLSKIEKGLHTISRSERKVATAVLAHPETVLSSSIARMANLAGVSEPTVNRFCRSFGARGFPDFKLRLAQTLAARPPLNSGVVNPEDSIPMIFHKITDQMVQSVHDLKDQINFNDIEKAVDTISQARSIALFGTGASGSVVHDAQHKLFRFNVPVVAYNDELMQRMHAASMAIGDLAIIVSYTGRTVSIIKAAELARSSGAGVLAITRSGSLLSQISSMVIPIDIDEDTQFHIPMVSRLMQLVILDVLVTGLAQRRGVGFVPHLLKVKKALEETRFPEKS